VLQTSPWRRSKKFGVAAKRLDDSRDVLPWVPEKGKPEVEAKKSALVRMGAQERRIEPVAQPATGREA
jgi:hypothetical protein